MSKKIDFEKLSLHKGPEVSLGFLLWRNSTLWRTSIETVLKVLELTHPQFVILASLGWLTQNGNLVTQREIGKMAALDPNTTSQILKGLEKKKLIERISSNDARVKNPILTKKGENILSMALPLVEKADEIYFEVLSKTEKQQLIKIFQKLMKSGIL